MLLIFQGLNEDVSEPLFAGSTSIAFSGVKELYPVNFCKLLADAGTELIVKVATVQLLIQPGPAPLHRPDAERLLQCKAADLHMAISRHVCRQVASLGAETWAQVGRFSRCQGEATS